MDKHKCPPGLLCVTTVTMRWGECQYKLPGSSSPEEGPEPVYVAYVSVLFSSIIC